MVFAYNNTKTIKISFTNNIFINFDQENNAIKISPNNPNIILTKITNQFNKLIFSFEDFFFKKIKFKGKGFRLKIKKKHKAIKFMFGHSHLNMAFIKNTKLKKLSKYKFILKSVNSLLLNKLSNLLCKIKPVNLYTNRGIRISRQIIRKRKGKKSSYI